MSCQQDVFSYPAPPKTTPPTVEWHVNFADSALFFAYAGALRVWLRWPFTWTMLIFVFVQAVCWRRTSCSAWSIRFCPPSGALSFLLCVVLRALRRSWWSDDIGMQRGCALGIDQGSSGPGALQH